VWYRDQSNAMVGAKLMLGMVVPLLSCQRSLTFVKHIDMLVVLSTLVFECQGEIFRVAIKMHLVAIFIS
jgi:hypothetical protein